MEDEARELLRELDAKLPECASWGAVLAAPVADLEIAAGEMKAAFRKLMLSGYMGDGKREAVRSEAIEEHRRAVAKFDRLLGQL